MNQYIIPANSKRSQLYFGLFHEIDMIILGAGILLSIMLFILLKSNTLWVTVLKVLPTIAAIFLVFPIPNYHNVRVLIREMFAFVFNQKRYYWRGWCSSYVVYTEQKAANK